MIPWIVGAELTALNVLRFLKSNFNNFQTKQKYLIKNDKRRMPNHVFGNYIPAPLK